MIPIERKWNDGEPWYTIGTGLFQVNEPLMWRRFWAQSDGRILPLQVRYSNGQLCTFRRKTKGQNNER